MKTLFLGYGNIDRQDDGVAWYLLLAVMKKLGAPLPQEPDDEMPINFGDYTFDFHLQLTPELAESLAEFDCLCIIDAHTGNVPEEIHTEYLTPHYQTSPFTHHMTASTLLSLCEVINHKLPESILVSVRGYEFGFSRSLSQRTSELVENASITILDWLTSKRVEEN